MGITATTLSNLAFYPLTTIRTRIQQEQFHFLENQTQVVDNQAKYNDVFDCIYKLWKFEGIKGFYKGFLPHLLKIAPLKGVYFFLYEFFKHSFKKKYTHHHSSH